jgi:uncharacterized membrane protein
MADPVDPTQPPPPPVSAPMHEPERNASSTGLPSNVAAALACIPLIGGIIFYILEKRDGFVRFYAMQSIVFGAAWFLFNIVSAVVHLIFSNVPMIGVFLVLLWGIINMVVQIAFLIVWIIATIKAFTNVRWEIPYLGPMARKQFEGNAAV